MIRSLILALSLACSSLAFTQQSPVFVFDSMMGTYFDASNGMVRLDQYLIAFKPEADQFTGQVVIVNQTNEILGQWPLFTTYDQEDGVFGRLTVQGPAELNLTEPGIYYIIFYIDGEPVSRMPFRMQQTGDGDDPFNPEKTYAFDGNWQTYAYLTMTGSVDEAVPQVNFWVGGSDLPESLPSGDQLLVSLYREGDLIAHSKQGVGFISPGRMERRKISLFHPHEKVDELNAQIFKLAEWQVSGAYEVRVTRQSDGELIRSYDFKSDNGEIEQHPRAALDYEPRLDLILPRVKISDTQKFELLEAIWIHDD